MGSLGLIVLLVLLVLLGQPLFVIMGSVTAYCFLFLGEGDLTGIIEDIYYGADKEILLAIPLFILAGNLMTYGSIARRLIDMGRAYTAPIPSGLAIAGVFACAIFAAISGSSPVTLIAIGGIMYPALQKAGYDKQFSMGLLTSGGTLGIIIPPSIPMIIYAIMVGVSVTDLFKAGIGPGILLVFMLMGYSMYKGWNMPRGKWVLKEIGESTLKGFLALMMPVIILGGIYSGIFTATESAAIAVMYALFVELVIHRELKVTKIPQILVESAEMLGSLLLILLLATSLNKFLTIEQVPQSMVEYMSTLITSPIAFIIGVNILLLIVGFFMDIMSAILVLAPLLAPMAASYGINPIHFGIIMIVNLEIGYITPPVGINLFVASGIFKEALGDVIKSVVPIIGIFLVALMLISFIPQIALFTLPNETTEMKAPDVPGTNMEEEEEIPPGGSFLDKY
ncbi:TRAP transporter large permease [Leptospira sp. GIMC2001]|uniref:TRAP transporter large permease n=1 Tax=Leptospira sp. GIMC2001 TaxID=1513297 RepID=UPI00234BD7B2|nr:TRAP transporter large permease [Leptospira sp. GIMC2001]WCL49903.1 TRAP transporter large permease [Leptospira sp. GIMC2001]